MKKTSAWHYIWTNTLFAIPFTIFVIIGIVSIIMAMRLYKLEQASSKWSVVPGTIIKIRVDINEYLDDDNTRRINYHVPMIYRYRVNGKDFTNDDYSPTQNPIVYYSKEEAYAAEEQYMKGTAVSVSCNPDDPSQAYISVKSGISVAVYLGFGFGLFMIIPALIAYFLCRPSRDEV